MGKSTKMVIPFALCRRGAAKMTRAKGITILSGLVHVNASFTPTTFMYRQH